MKRTVLLLCMSCFATGQLAAQEVIDTMYLFCQYKSDCIKLTAQKRVKDLIRLEIGKKLSVSYSYYTCQWDSFYCQPDHGNKLSEAFQQARDRGDKNPFEAFLKYPSPKTLTIVYKNYPKGKMTIFDRIDDTEYTYPDNLNSQDWKLTADTLTVLGYPCIRAVCDWRGREYEAWFTPEIPVSEGPLKFGGLPGLIMKLQDADHEWSYELEGVQRINRPITLRPPLKQKSYKKTIRLNFLRGYRRFLNNMGSMLDAGSDMKLGITSGAGNTYDLMERDY